jgi:hypothetical protein
MFRLYVDEVGTASLTHLDQDKHRYLSLTGVAIDIRHAADALEPNMNWIKASVLNHDPDSPIIFHRTDIMGFGGPFECLRDEAIKSRFDRSILRLFISTEFRIITAIIDKKAMITNTHWDNKEPYHYLMDILVEKYTQLLERNHVIGDIMPEGRSPGQNRLLQEAFTKTRNKGTFYVSSDRIKSAIRSENLKFRSKKDNIAGLQLCDLLAHPSHIIARDLVRHEVRLGAFTTRIREIMIGTKYDRSATGKIIGYGIKWAS